MIDFHADDYGMFKKESERILNCSINGALTGISIMPTGKDFIYAMEQLYNNNSLLLNNLTIHLNLMEGHCCSNTESINKIVDENGYFNLSFEKLVLFSYVPGVRKKYFSQIKKELETQILNAKPYFKNNSLQIDSHYHIHMVPIVFDALMAIINENKLDVCYIRMPVERFSIYCGSFHKLKDFKLINIIKALVLNICYARNYMKYHNMIKKYKKKIFSGVMCSGRMIYENIDLILPKICEKAKKNNLEIELLFHPGAIKEESDLRQLTRSDSKKFFTDSYRDREADALMRLTE